jgi:hypothetical protein
MRNKKRKDNQELKEIIKPKRVGGMTIRQWTILGVMGTLSVLAIALFAWALATYGKDVLHALTNADEGIDSGQSIEQDNSFSVETKGEVFIDPENIPPPNDGFFLWTGSGWQPMVGLWDDATLDLASVPSINQSSPIFAVQGEGYQVGVINLSPYYAGIGVDLIWTLDGVLVKTAYEGLPAAKAGIRANDVLKTVDGIKLIPDLIRSSKPDQADLFGIMKDPIFIEVITGTTQWTAEVSRTYTGSINESVIMTYKMFHPPEVKFTLNAKTNYVLLIVNSKLEQGVYRWEMPGRIPTPRPGGIRVGGLGPTPKPTPTWTPAPTAIIAPVWPFIIQD